MSDSGKPDAWGLLVDDEILQISLERDTIDRAAANAHAAFSLVCDVQKKPAPPLSTYAVVPLYRSPALTTTPEQEREVERLRKATDYAVGWLMAMLERREYEDNAELRDLMDHLLASRAPEEGIHG